MMAHDHSVHVAGGKLGPHCHMCAFFNGSDEEHRVLRSFIRDGIERGEKSFHLIDGQQRDDYLKRLGEAGINLERTMATGQLEVRPWEEAYLRGDHFDQDAMLALAEDVIASSATSGYPLIRFIAHMEWALLDKPGVEDLIE
jgi:hypothetical protein